MCYCLSQTSRTWLARRLREASRTANPLCLHVAPRVSIYCSSPLVLCASPLSSKSLGRPSVLLLTFFMSHFGTPSSLRISAQCESLLLASGVTSVRSTLPVSGVAFSGPFPASGSAWSISSWTRCPHFAGSRVDPAQNPS